MNLHAPIGIFDSGVGGLPLLQNLSRKFPQESFIYLADNSYMPYGEKSKQEVKELTLKKGEILNNLGCKMVLIACMSASVTATEALQAELSVPVIGLNELAATIAIQTSQTKHLAIIGTKRTIESGVIQQRICQLSEEAVVTSLICQELAPCIERGGSPSKKLLLSYLERSTARPIDTLILGCTHYPLILPLFKELLREGIEMVDPAAGILELIEEQLQLHKIAAPQAMVGTTRFFITGPVSPFKEIAQRILGKEIFPLPILEKCSYSTSKT